MSAHASQAFSIAHCTDSEDLPHGQCQQAKLADTWHTPTDAGLGEGATGKHFW